MTVFFFSVATLFSFAFNQYYLPQTNRIIGKDFSEQRLHYLQSFQEEAFCKISPDAKILLSMLSEIGGKKDTPPPKYIFDSQ